MHHNALTIMTNKTFWLTNTSNRNVSLADLNLTIKAYSTVNLLDKKHYEYTLEQLVKSIESGSLFKKKSMISLRKVPPQRVKSDILFNRESFTPSRSKSILEIKQENYEELEMSDEQFALENADIELGLDNSKQEKRKSDVK